MHALLGLVLASLAHGGPAVDTNALLHLQAERAAQRAPFGLLVLVEKTRLVAISRSQEPFVLVLASPDGGALVARTIAPGMTLDTFHPPLGLAGLTLEVVAAPEGRWTSSGRLALDGDALTLGLQASRDAAAAPLLTVLADRPLVQLQGSLPFPSSVAVPLHVPIPAPSDQPPKDGPPPIENEPLPPV